MFSRRLKICISLSTRLHHLLEFFKPTTGGRFSICLSQKFLHLQRTRTVDFLFNPHSFSSHHDQDADREQSQHSSLMSRRQRLRAAPLHVNTRSRRPTFFYQQLSKTPDGSEEPEHWWSAAFMFVLKELYWTLKWVSKNLQNKFFFFCKCLCWVYIRTVPILWTPQ